MDPFCPNDDGGGSEFQPSVNRDHNKPGTKTNMADSSDPPFVTNNKEDIPSTCRIPQVTQLLQAFGEIGNTVIPPLEMDPIKTMNSSDRDFMSQKNQDIGTSDLIENENLCLTEEEWQWIVEVTDSECCGGGGGGGGGGGVGCSSGVVGPFVKYANVTSHRGNVGRGEAVSSFMQYGFHVRVGNETTIWRWMGGSTRGKGPSRRKRKYRGVYETELEAAVKQERIKLKNRETAALAFEKKRAYIIQLEAQVQKLRQENEFHKKMLMFLEGTTRVDIPRTPPKRTISGPM